MFVALTLPDEIVRSLQNLQVEAKRMLPVHSISDEIKATADNFRTPHSPWRLCDTNNLHLTIEFIGDRITHHKYDEIASELSKISHEKFSIKCSGVGAYPNPDGARVLWAGAESKSLDELAKKVAQNIAKTGILPDKPFSPHITVARCKFPSNVSDFVRTHEETEWHNGEWRVDSFSLFESVHALGGQEYCELKRYPLV